MQLSLFRCLRLAAPIAALWLLQTPAQAQDAQALSHLIAELERDHQARIGVVVRDSGSDWAFGYRETERFAMTSTFKIPLCAAVLDRVAMGSESLAVELPVEQADLLDYAPVTTPEVGKRMTLAQLCQATIDMSDNTAANLLLDHIGGPQVVTEFLRRIGDPVTRLDRREPELNLAGPGELRDTTTPQAMVATLERLFLGDALPRAERAQLWDWSGRGGVTQALLRAALPEDWQVADKSGAGAQSRALVAVVQPPQRAPYLVAIYLAESPDDFQTRNAAVAALSAEIAKLLQAR